MENSELDRCSQSHSYMNIGASVPRNVRMNVRTNVGAISQ